MLVEVRELSKVYFRNREEVHALRSANISIKAGSFVIITGPSGCGKSTLLHLLGGIDRPTGGNIIFNDKHLEEATEDELTRFRRENIGFVFQFYNLLPSLDSLDNVCLPLYARGVHRAEARKQANDVLERVGLDSRLHHKPSELSGGEQQRVAIARAIIGKPCLVLADEPTGDLDAESARSIMKLMQEINQQLGTTFLVATHNAAFTEFSDCIFELSNGVLKERSCS